MTEDDEGEHDIAGLAAAMRSGEIDRYLKSARRQLDDDAWAGFADAAVAAHRRGGKVDLVTILKGDSARRVGYATQQLVDRAVPAVVADVDDVLALTADASARNGGEPPYWILSALSRWCEVSSANAAAALDAVRAGRAAAGIMHSVVAAGMKVDRARFLPIAIAMLEGSEATEQDIAANLLGRIEDLAPNDLARSVSALEGALARASGERVAAPLRALLAIAIRDVAAASIGVAALDEVRGRADGHVREAVATEMMFGASKAEAALTRSALALLHDAGADETATIEAIDQILSQHLSGPLAPDAASLADRLLSGEAATMKRLDSYEYHLLADTTGALTAAVTRWLLADSIPLYNAVRDVCQAVHGEEPLTFALDLSGAGLSPERAVRIARRSCGVLLLWPEAAASIIAGMMQTGPAEAIPALAATLWDPLLVSYWTGPRRYLEDVLPGMSPPAADAVTDAIAKLDRYAANVEKARNLAELRPSQQHRHIAALRRHQEQLAIEKAARDGSTLASLFPMSIMMFGDSAIYDVVTEPGKSIRKEAKMGVHEYSHELPRLDVIDPFGTWYQRARMIKDGDLG